MYLEQKCPRRFATYKPPRKPSDTKHMESIISSSTTYWPPRAIGANCGIFWRHAAVRMVVTCEPCQMYDVYILMSSTAKPWMTKEWLGFEPIIAPLFATKETAIRCLKYRSGQGSMSLGRLGWNEKSHAKWTVSHSNERFVRVALWSTSWTHWARTGKTPLYFFNIHNFDNSMACLFALPKGSPREPIAALAALWRAKVAHRALPWAKASSSTYENCLCDQRMTCLPFKTSDHLPADLTKVLRPGWQAITFRKKSVFTSGWLGLPATRLRETIAYVHKRITLRACEQMVAQPGKRQRCRAFAGWYQLRSSRNGCASPFTRSATRRASAPA